jgi:dihydrolipoamide dehydrogenase
MAEQYDVVVLGGGPGGYVAAIRAAQLGLSVALIEKDKLGGTCLHRGCIPSKSMLRSAEVYSEMKESESYGIATQSVELKFDLVQNRKNGIVDQLHKGIEHLMKKNKIDVIQGNGRVMGPSIFSPLAGTIAVEKPDGETELVVPRNLILATGSSPRSLPGLNVDGKYVMTSDEALQMEELPKSIIIIGGGVIGIEWASMLSDFGVEVTVVEFDKRILNLEDEDISKEMERLLKKRKVKVLTDAKALPDTFKVENDQITIDVERKGEKVTLQADRLLVSVGRTANIDDIGLVENTEIVIEKGAVKVNQFMQTKEKHIYAIGDINGKLPLAHVASHEGIMAVEHIAGLNPEPMQYHLVPRCTYSRPEVASVGWTEQQAKEQGHEVKVGKFNFRGIGKALIYGEVDGFVKIVADSKTNDILGVHMIGPHVTDYISEAALAQVLDATPWEIGHTIHPHPTLSEAIAEAALAVDGKAIHS